MSMPIAESCPTTGQPSTGEPKAGSSSNFPAAEGHSPSAARRPAGAGVFKAFGLTISSCIACPELPAASGEAHAAVVYGDVPAHLPGAKEKGVCYQAGPGQVLLGLDGIARFWVREGKEIVVERHPGAGDDDLRLFLLGSPFGALLQQRGHLVLNGSMVEADGGCVILAGGTGLGKSTLAAALWQRGYRVLSDDVCTITLGEDGVPFAVGSYPRLKLWPDSLERLGINPTGLRRVRSCLTKRSLPVEAAFCGERLPVKRVYWLRVNRSSPDIELHEVTGPDKMRLLTEASYRKEFLQGQGLAAVHFRQLANIVPRVTVMRVGRPAEQFAPDRLADLIESEFRP